MKRRLFYFFEDCFMRFFRMLHVVFPLAWVAPTGRVIGTLFTNLATPYKRQILARLRTAFPEKSEQEIRRLFRSTVRNGGEVMFEQLMVSEKMITRDLKRTHGFETFDELVRGVYARGHGLICVGTHMNNWEKLMGIGAYRVKEIMNTEINVVMNRMPTPYLDSLVTVLRNRILKCRFLYTKRSRYFINQVLDRRGIVVFASDVDYRYKGLFVPFMGRKISMGRGPAHYAVTRDVPLCFIMLYRDEQDRLNLHFEEVEGKRTGDTEQDIYNLTAALAARIEHWVRRYPDQWFGWMQQPWKTPPVEDLEAALSKEPKNHRIMEQIGQYYLAKDRPEAAKEIFQRALVERPDSTAANRELGRLLMAEGAVDRAVVHVERTLTVRPRDHEALKLMGRAFMARVRYKTALDYFHRARRVRFDDGEAYWGIGRCLDLLGDREKAVAVYRKGLRMNEDYAPLHAALALIYASQPDKQEALHEHLTALTHLHADLPQELDPTSGPARRGRRS